MKKKIEKEKIKKNYLLIIFIIIQTIFYIITGSYKEDLHIDEAYSFGLCNYDKVEIEDNVDFFENWHTKDYYEDYLSIQDKDRGDFTPVYENQKNDVHPPLYYMLLRISMELQNEVSTKWTGIIPNIILYMFITIFMYLIIKKLFGEEENLNIKAGLLAFMSSITLASLSNAIYIRMYTLLTLEILITLYLHIKLLESNKSTDYKLLTAIGITVISGILTHYYYIFYIAFLYLLFFIKYIKEKNVKKLIYYTVTMFIFGIIALIIFPYLIQHIFFGYRGQGVISSLTSNNGTIKSVFTNIEHLDYYGFNGLMYLILGGILIIWLYNKINKKGEIINKENREILKVIFIPVLIFFVIVSIASPWKVLRYIVPVCGIMFVVVSYLLYKLLKTVFSENISNVIISIMFGMMLVSPFILKLEPELLYRNKGEIRQKLSEKLNLPTMYMYKEGDGFLNNIWLFRNINESYITNRESYTEEDIQEILKTKDITKGIIVFISEIDDTDLILETIKNGAKLENSTHLKKLEHSNVYYIK